MIPIFFSSFRLRLLHSIFLPFIILSLTSCSPTVRIPKRKQTVSIPSNTIRVLLDKFSGERKLVFNNPVNLKTGTSNTERVPAGDVIHISVDEGRVRIRLNRYSFTEENLSIEPLPDKRLTYKDKKYRGAINLRADASEVLIINVVDIEDYLRGVLYSEMGVASKPGDYEALKAFTICARNFALMKINEGRKNFDVYGDIRDQVYAGADGEKNYINRAVDETRGMLLMYDNQIAKTFYFSSCGGYTEDCGNVFREQGIEYLRTVRDGSEPNCSIAPGYKWTEKYSFREVISYLKSAGLLDEDNIQLKDISVESRFPSGRIKELAVITSSRNGERKILLKGNNIRYIIKTKNGGLLRSTMCDVEIKGKEVIISGEGNGHGVGFCQWGAIGQSRKGKSYEEILYFYFPNTKIGGDSMVIR